MRGPSILLMITFWVCRATEPPPYFYQQSVINRVSAAAKGGLTTADMALNILERLAEGRMDLIDPHDELLLGLEAGQLHKPEFQDEGVRSYALRRIGELDRPEAMTYLEQLKKDDILPDISGRMSSAAQIALRQAQLNRIQGESNQIHFLEDTTSDRSAAAWWAVDELCNRGSYSSRSFIGEYIRRTQSVPQEIERISGFCEARMAVVSRDADRIKALASVLSVANGSNDRALMVWAIHQLGMLQSPRVEAELRRYVKEIDGLAPNSPRKREFANAHDSAILVLRQRSK